MIYTLLKHKIGYYAILYYKFSYILLERKSAFLHLFETENSCVKTLVFLLGCTHFDQSTLLVVFPYLLYPLCLLLFFEVILGLIFSLVFVVVSSEFENPFRVYLATIVNKI